MARPNYTVEQIIVKLREVEILCSQGKSMGEAVSVSQHITGGNKSMVE